MSLYSRILTERKTRLSDKGYEEEQLDAAEPSGTMLDLLQTKLFQVVLDTFLSDKAVEFSIPMAGYFNDRRDKVLFEFCYVYDPDRTRLQLLKLKAQLEDTRMEFPVWNDNPRDLLAAGKVYQKLLLKRRQVLSPPNTPPVQTHRR
jgi:hypothetical protein